MYWKILWGSNFVTYSLGRTKIYNPSSSTWMYYKIRPERRCYQYFPDIVSHDNFDIMDNIFLTATMPSKAKIAQLDCPRGVKNHLHGRIQNPMCSRSSSPGVLVTTWPPGGIVGGRTNFGTNPGQRGHKIILFA